MSGCQSSEESQDSLYYDEWIDYTAEELQEIFWRHEEAFDYIVQTLKKINDAKTREDKASFEIVIEDPKKGNLLFILKSANNKEFTDGSDLGYEKDELFERYVNEILVGEKFSKITISKGSGIDFGYNSPIYYDENAPVYEENDEEGGSLKEHWFYHIQSYV